MAGLIFALLLLLRLLIAHIFSALLACRQSGLVVSYQVFIIILRVKQCYYAFGLLFCTGLKLDAEAARGHTSRSHLLHVFSKTRGKNPLLFPKKIEYMYLFPFFPSPIFFPFNPIHMNILLNNIFQTFLLTLSILFLRLILPFFSSPRFHQ